MPLAGLFKIKRTIVVTEKIKHTLWWWRGGDGGVSVGWWEMEMMWGGDDAGGVIRCGGDIGDGVRRLVKVADGGGWPELGRSDAEKMRGGSGG
ncbi:hypothetical protein Tco_0652016 [Tanacetum coccineum]|uniref:Uncharacterized protein n=1 Tax=Tanacetum coccineum TaxID=301880 RepID=A0ABQ4WWF7_9ASTR